MQPLRRHANGRKYRIACLCGDTTISDAYIFGNLAAANELLTFDVEHFCTSSQMNSITTSHIL